MKAIFDVDYRDNQKEAQAACVVFENWTDASPFVVIKEKISPIAPYEPGAFYKRELPCIQQTLEKLYSQGFLRNPLSLERKYIDLIIIDGFVWLGPDHPGLGVKLYEALAGFPPIIGVAKTSFHSATPVPVLRGESKNPLLVTAIGMDPTEAATHIKNMHGNFRIPTLLKLADQSCRGWH